jgi:hypothetical protein
MCLSAACSFPDKLQDFSSPHRDFLLLLVLNLLGLAPALFSFLFCVHQSQQLPLPASNPAQILHSSFSAKQVKAAPFIILLFPISSVVILCSVVGSAPPADFIFSFDLMVFACARGVFDEMWVRH